jgi:hypothetical protein
MRALKTLAATAALAALAGGCGSDDQDKTEQVKPAAATSKSATASLAGSYGRTMTAADLERTDPVRRAGHQEAGPNQEPPPPGPAALTLSDGTLKLHDPRLKVTIAQDFSATVDGAFQIGAYQNPDTGAFCGPDVPQTATYSWKLSGDVLTLKARKDPCADRDSYLSGAWKPR